MKDDGFEKLFNMFFKTMADVVESDLKTPKKIKKIKEVLTIAARQNKILKSRKQEVDRAYQDKLGRY